MTQLTKHREGSLRELWSISFPLMLSSLSVLMMVFVDRLFLMNYSLEAFTAAINASTLGWSFIFGWLVLASIDEVFVAQYNGADKKHKIGEPVWQMLWLSVLSMLFFIPLAYYNGSWFFGNGSHAQLQRDYFGWMMLFGFSFPMYGALCGFFIGQGKVRIVTILAISANIVNAVLDWILIFGFRDIVPSLGVKGAAIATCTSELFQALILLCVFLNHKNRSLCGTNDFRLKWKPLWECIKIGSPAAICIMVEILGWAMYYKMMRSVSDIHITVAGIGQTVIIVLYFFSEGLSKGVTAVIGNFIGANRYHMIPKTVKSGLIMNFIFFVLIFVPLVFFPSEILSLFLFENSEATVLQFGNIISITLFFAAVYMLFEGLRYMYAGALIAAGDTKFLMLTGSTLIWILLIAPVYFLIVRNGGSIILSQSITVLYSIVIYAVVYGRYVTGHWKNITLTEGSI